MTPSALVVVILVVFLLVGGVIVWFLLMEGSENSPYEQFGEILSAQRGIPAETAAKKAFFSTPETEDESIADRSKLTLAKKLRMAQVKMSPAIFWVWSIAIGVLAFLLAVQVFNLWVSFLFLFVGWLIMSTYLSWRLDRRFNAFDKDYSQFLLSLVGLLKTGMNTLTSLGAAAEGLEPGALVRQEVEMMLERLRFGVPEEKSIGAFGEDINHPEIELFVQALLLNKRLGGTLSDTLDRLAKQVRRRQFFRQSAIAAIGLQKGSMWFIIVILVFLELYLFWVMPEAVIDSLKHPYGWLGWQIAMVLAAFGILWLKQVVKIRV
ncbi:MAG: hypothetical protein GYA55_09780 [SAR324 cluster bacterium]|uniref:Type II secretion system protein GspF domain-containing protein n=1 Tax=SAR324 cluster bacterium TaxID=2024889 RepID=A0A7X9FSE0_9DELT|nr:hypothetical protein [SAR324 cluster bacterium]